MVQENNIGLTTHTPLTQESRYARQLQDMLAQRIEEEQLLEVRPDVLAVWDLFHALRT